MPYSFRLGLLLIPINGLHPTKVIPVSDQDIESYGFIHSVPTPHTVDLTNERDGPSLCRVPYTVGWDAEEDELTACMLLFVLAPRLTGSTVPLTPGRRQETKPSVIKSI